METTNDDLKKKIDELESAVSSAKVELEARTERDKFRKEVDTYMDRLINEQEVIAGQLTFNLKDKLQCIKDRLDQYIESDNAGDYAIAKQMYLKLQEKYSELTDRIRDFNASLSSFDTTLTVLKNS